MKTIYELVLILRSTIEEKEKEKILEEIKKSISPGKIKEIVDWGKKIFAYSIKKEKDGYYLLAILETEGKEAVKIPKLLQTNEQILRFLLVRKE